jgi:hypothetical protein
VIIPRYIPDLVGAVVGRVNTILSSRPNNPLSVFYAFGHHAEVVRLLTEKDGNPNKPAKYPLVWLVTPFKEESVPGEYVSVSELRLILANDTVQTYSMEERRDNVFIPILYLILAYLLEELKNSKDFVTKGEPAYEKTDLQYARVDSTGTNLLNDFVDVIDLKIRNITVKAAQVAC